MTSLEMSNSLNDKASFIMSVIGIIIWPIDAQCLNDYYKAQLTFSFFFLCINKLKKT